jgi:hypothetical protein
LWDPLRDLVGQPYSVAELQRMAELGAELASLSNAALAMQREQHLAENAHTESR